MFPVFAPWDFRILLMKTEAFGHWRHLGGRRGHQWRRAVHANPSVQFSVFSRWNSMERSLLINTSVRKAAVNGTKKSEMTGEQHEERGGGTQEDSTFQLGELLLVEVIVFSTKMKIQEVKRVDSRKTTRQRLQPVRVAHTESVLFFPLPFSVFLSSNIWSCPQWQSACGG